MPLDCGKMVYSSEEIINKLKSDEVVKLYNDRNINSVIVFGSVVTESFEEYSDVDIAVISNNKLTLSTIMDIEEKLQNILFRDIDILNLRNDDLDLNIKVSIFDNGLVVYNDELDLYSKEYNKVERIYKDNEEFRYFRERDVIYDE